MEKCQAEEIDGYRFMNIHEQAKSLSSFLPPHFLFCVWDMYVCMNICTYVCVYKYMYR